MSRLARKEVIELFVNWSGNKWDLYPRCYELYKTKKVTKKFIMDIAFDVRNIPAGVVDMRLRYMKQLDKQVRR